MSRYNLPTGLEGEFEPGSRRKVLRNQMGIKNLSLMNHAEDRALESVENLYLESGKITVKTKITAQIIRQMHTDWLGDIYEWAGKYRTVDMSKGDFRFPPARLVAQNMSDFERNILSQHTLCSGKSVEEISLSIAIVHAELLLIHPFREGNGRLAR